MYIIYFIIPLVFSIVLNKPLIAFLNKYRMVDLPNQRKNHNNPIPRGGGITIISIILLCCITIFNLQYTLGNHFIYLILAISICAAISLLDDIFTISVHIRI